MRTRTSAKMGVCAALLCLISACNDAGFNSTTKKQTPPGPSDASIPSNATTNRTLKLSCDTQGVAKLVTDVSGSAKTLVQLQGEFCNVSQSAASGDLTILFVLDFSGSMTENDPTGINDNSCGRLKAAQAIVSKVNTAAQTGINVKYGVLQFSDAAHAPIAPVNSASFSANLTADTFCGNDGGATNYQAAFDQAQKTLQPLSGNKVIYFISDGLPTRSGTGVLGSIFGGSTDDNPQAVYDAGQRAAESLRNTVTNLTLNAIFLGTASDPTTDPTLPPDFTLPDPQSYLEKITGSKDLVRVVSSADSLAQQIQTFQTPTAATLDTSSVVGTITGGALGQQTVELQSLTKDPTRAGVWSFITKPFELYGQSGQTTNNQVTLTVKSSDGKQSTASADIKFNISQ